MVSVSAGTIDSGGRAEPSGATSIVKLTEKADSITMAITDAAKSDSSSRRVTMVMAGEPAAMVLVCFTGKMPGQMAPNDGVGETVAVTETEGEIEDDFEVVDVGEGEREREMLTLGNSVLLGVIVGVKEGDAVSLLELVAVTVAVSETLVLPLDVVLPLKADAERLADALCEAVALAEEEALALMVREAVSLPLRVRLADDEEDGVELDVAVGEIVAVADTVADAVELEVSVRDTDAERDALKLCEREALAVRVGDGDALRVAVRLALGLALALAVRLIEGLEEMRLRDGEEVEDDVTVDVADDEGDAVDDDVAEAEGVAEEEVVAEGDEETLCCEERAQTSSASDSRREPRIRKAAFEKERRRPRIGRTRTRQYWAAWATLPGFWLST